MKVYILTAKCWDSRFVEGVFSSFSAMLTYLKSMYGYESIATFTSDGIAGHFKDGCKLGDRILEWKLTYDVYDVIDEHSAKDRMESVNV